MRVKGWVVGRVVGVLALASLLSGCWLQVGYSPEHANFNPIEDQLTTTNVASLAPEWSGHVDGNSHSEPIVSGGRVYVSHMQLRSIGGPGGPRVRRVGVTALDAATGERVWGRNIGPDMADADDVEPEQVVLVGDELWVSYYGSLDDGSCTGALVRLDAATGAVQGTVFSGRASAVVHFDGKVAWTGQRLEPSGSCDTSAGAELVVQNEATGTTRWTAPSSTVDLPAVIGDKILVAGTAYPRNGCRASTCNSLWSANVDDPITAQTGSSEGHIFLTTATPDIGGDQVVAVDPASGAALWSVHTAIPALHDGHVAVAGDFLYVAGRDGVHDLRAFAIDGCGSANCEPLWSSRLPGPQNPIVGGPVVAGGVVYIVDDFRLAAFPAAGCGAATCTPLTWLDVSGGPVSVSDGKVFVSTQPGTGNPRVQAFAPTGQRPAFEAIPPGGPAPDGRIPAVAISSSAYTVRATAWNEPWTYYMNVWGPDPDAYLTESSWLDVPGEKNCLAGSGSELNGSDGESHALHWGLVRADAAEVRIVTTGGLWTSAVIGSEITPGLRAWIGERPPGQTDRFEALDASGNVLHTATSPTWVARGAC